ncbi:MAG: pirin family protein [Azonexus sp.]|jgi:redox-sensitive bicupin YhaK (pirin superfamily)|nr:pirin family protein [Azonexus sp.]
MIQIRKSEDRGHANFGWLDARYSFSFANYHDPRHMGISALRVINQDRVEPGRGFPPHSHDNMEILTYILRGAVTHQDSMGNETRLPAGEFQLMSAGSGITHSEYNREGEPLELLQIWLLPNVADATPRYQQKRFPAADGLQLIVSPDGADDSLRIRQNARIYHGRLKAGSETRQSLAGENGWAQIISGEIDLNGNTLQDGDGAAISGEAEIAFAARRDSEFLLFDLP